MKQLGKRSTLARGFTATELLIVIVFVIALLVISAIAYNSMQTRANTSAAQTSLATFSKKIQAYHKLTGKYPAATNAVISDLSRYPESKLQTTELAIGVPTADSGGTTTKIELCGNGAGVKLTPFDYTIGTVSTTVTNMGDVSGACVLATA